MADSPSEAWLDAVGALGPPLLQGLDGLEQAFRRLHPSSFPALREALEPVAARLGQALDAFRGVPAPDGLEDFCERFAQSARHARDALDGLMSDGPPHERIARVLGAMRRHCRAQESAYPLRKALPPLSRYFVEAPFRDQLERLDPEPAPPGVGLHRAAGDPDARGGFSLYVPESYDDSAPWPLVVALHGGSGQGRDFLWTWLREARGRRFLLLAPTSRGSTWSLDLPDRDAGALDAMVREIGARWRVDPQRVLLTGLSDGATYSFLCGLREDSPFTALAPIAGVLHPLNFANGNLERARGRRIYLVHGTLDWMFPVSLARAAAEELTRAGADLCFREIEDLSHAYPREENDRILRWFDPGLALPAQAAPC